MKLKYSFIGQVFRYQLVVSFIFALIIYIYVRVYNHSSEGLGIFTLFVGFLYLSGWIHLWIHPLVIIEENGIVVVRLGVIKRKIKWNNLKLYKKLRTLTKYGTIGLDPRYALLKIKDATFFDKYVIILPFFDDYDAFVAQIADKLSEEK